MASKENQELMHKLCNEILTTIQFNTNRDVITGLQKAIDDLELYKSLFNSPDTKPNNDDDIIECICLVREIHTKKVMLEVCDWCYGEWDIANNFELLGWTLARKELENGK